MQGNIFDGLDGRRFTAFSLGRRQPCSALPQSVGRSHSTSVRKSRVDFDVKVDDDLDAALARLGQANGQLLQQQVIASSITYKIVNWTNFDLYNKQFYKVALLS